MELIYNNFDALDISFQGALSIEILDQLSKAREQAQDEKREVYTELGKVKLPAMVAETGSRGGYRYRFDTGPDDETWFVAHSTNSKMWNIRVSVKSLSLALSGYEAVKQKIINRLIALKAIGQRAYTDEISGSNKHLMLPRERISRFDYCFDFAMPNDFEPDPKLFVAHQRSKKHAYGEEGIVSNYSSLNGDKVNTVRIGEMPGRQAVIYNKTKEIGSSLKNYMWDIWDIDPEPFKEGFKQIWRIEVRAGRDELDKWGLKRFDEFEDKTGDVVAGILKAIRYTKPLKDDLNRSRWPNHQIWREALSASLKALEPYSTNAIRENIITDYRENVISGYIERLIGNAIGLTAAEGRDISELTIVLEELQDKAAKTDPQILKDKFDKAEERFRFLV